ncbi:MAG: hypothetical protein LBT97_10820 [Planctomycetota bacterium]|jgi:hypothetical protein|nr:hypothetical protein [Planctomycetota bacterium]
MENHTRDGNRSAGHDPDLNQSEQGRQSAHTMTGNRFAWEALLRAMFLLFVTGAIAFLAWRPGVWRFNFAFTFGNPPPGDRLDWKAEEDEPIRKMPVPGSPQPPEWRLTANNFFGWNDSRFAKTNLDLTTKSVAETDWRRETRNAWSWEDDVPFRSRREPIGMPPQIPMTSFRAGDMPGWPQPGVEEKAEKETFPELPVIAPPAQTGISVGASESPDAAASQSAPAPSTPVTPPMLPPPIRRGEPAAVTATGTVAIAEAPILIGVGNPSKRAESGDMTHQATIDWKNREITGPIPGAFLTIYPDLKFIGLCLPDQGYIRSYHQVGVPESLEGDKMSAHDGRVPYGRYYVADRYRDADGPRLFLSWPSPEDGRRIGLDPIRQAEVENAWRRRELPPQDTEAGGGVGISGLRRWVDVTEGGFALEEPQMEEIFTALPDKSWVIIQNK